MKVAAFTTPRSAARVAPSVVLGALVVLGYAAARLWSDGEIRAADPKSAADAPTRKSNGPQYNDKGELKLPADFYTWVFVGSNLGIEYREAGAPDAAPEKNAEKPDKLRNFHNIYIHPEAYEQYAKSGKFPEKTVLVLDMYKAEAGEPKSVVSDGRFPGKQTGVAVAVKNSARPDGGKSDWAYYEFALDQPAAKAFPNKACYDCHLQHADDDNVWVQFYPTLRRLRADKDKR